MRPRTLVRFTILASALIAPAAFADETAAMEEGINLCVEMREKIFACKEDFAEAFVAKHNPPPEQRAAMKAKALEEIIADGSGPLPPRRQVCADMAKRGPRPPAEKIGEMKKGLEQCAAKPDCKSRTACIMPLIRPMVGKGQTVKR